MRRCGETAWLIDLPDNDTVHDWAAAVRERGMAGVVEVVPGLTTLLVSIDPDVATQDELRHQLRDLAPEPRGTGDQRRHTIEVDYDGEDLTEVARLTGLSASEVIAAHTGTPWHVAFCGFAPGFSYLVGGDPRLQVPRRDESRVRVPAGSVAVAGQFSSVYPRVSPGGWQLLGTTDATLWDLSADPPGLLLPGDVVDFRDAGAS